MSESPYLQMARRFVDAIPHNKALGMQVVALERARVTIRLPARAELGGDPDRGLYFPSVLLTLADAACGVAFVSAINSIEAVATLDLRIDYLRPIPVEHAVIAVAHCHRHTDDVGFLHCDLRAEGGEVPAALVTASFMRTGKRAQGVSA